MPSANASVIRVSARTFERHGQPQRPALDTRPPAPHSAGYGPLRRLGSVFRQHVSHATVFERGVCRRSNGSQVRAAHQNPHGRMRDAVLGLERRKGRARGLWPAMWMHLAARSGTPQPCGDERAFRTFAQIDFKSAGATNRITRGPFPQNSVAKTMRTQAELSSALKRRGRRTPPACRHRRVRRSAAAWRTARRNRDRNEDWSGSPASVRCARSTRAHRRR